MKSTLSSCSPSPSKFVLPMATPCRALLVIAVAPLTSYLTSQPTAAKCTLSHSATARMSVLDVILISSSVHSVQRRPTSSLIGPLQVASNLGYWLISVSFLIGALYLMQSDPDYVAWPTRLAPGANWYVQAHHAFSLTIVNLFNKEQILSKCLFFPLRSLVVWPRSLSDKPRVPITWRSLKLSDGSKYIAGCDRPSHRTL